MEEAEAFVDLNVPAVVVERRVPQSLWLEENWNDTRIGGGLRGSRY